ncbi:hypothetical protein DB35_10350 [Streptomyces abyssalis]|uniref:Uncharacterized protein n=1 Tax=Streptomyces abyssalis TaxID=933944 RepID=A0A1E7JHZ8_9ACTN|nr:hypothetical protein [Streptomyces abyssalis]OEU86080.1 hypothetical protein AN215_27550 [Streptomyces abyssalis]OEU92454.1 hypothetical protein DB35_10350 [Streptomyces abyssalis]
MDAERDPALVVVVANGVLQKAADQPAELHRVAVDGRGHGADGEREAAAPHLVGMAGGHGPYEIAEFDRLTARRLPARHRRAHGVVL